MLVGLSSVSGVGGDVEIFDGLGTPSSLLLPSHGVADTEWSGETDGDRRPVPPSAAFTGSPVARYRRRHGRERKSNL